MNNTHTNTHNNITALTSWSTRL